MASSGDRTKEPTQHVPRGDAAEDRVVLFADVAGRFTHMGPSGAGMGAKMLNQLIVGCGHAVMAEAVILAEAAGIDAARLPECLAGGHAAGDELLGAEQVQKVFLAIAEQGLVGMGGAGELAALGRP